jgi:general secretion pathway protein N
MAGAGLLTTTAAPLSRPQIDEPAAIGAETTGLGVNSQAPANAGSRAAERPAPANPLWAIPISNLSATRDRPLFSPTRRPRPAAVAAAPEPRVTTAVAPPPAATPPFTLVGTIIGDNNRIAIFFDAASKISTGVREGESASGWTLRSVDSRSAVVEGNGQTLTLGLPEPEAQGGGSAKGPGGRQFMIDNPNGL